MSEENNILLEKNELIPGVILIKEFKMPENNSEEQIIGMFIYKIKLIKMNILNLEVDFSQSKNIKIKNKNNRRIKVSIMPFEIKIIAEIYLENDFQINPKFKFNLIIPDKATQLKYLNQFEENKNQLYQKLKQEINKYPFEYMDLEEINEILSNLNLNFIDINFMHEDESLIGNYYKKSDLNYIIHWRRPNEFLNNEKIKIFNINNSPLINDIKQGLFPFNNLDCVLNALTEKNNLIKRLIVNENINNNGIYKIKLCIKGEWITVIIDDYFPCLPFSTPVVSSTFSNDLWVLLVEKALAKTFGNYYNLMNIDISHYLNILTGCPTVSYDILDLIQNKNGINNFLNILKENINEKKYLIIAISNHSENFLTTPDIGYTILDIIHQNEDIFIALRINIFGEKSEKNYENYIKKLNKKYQSIINEYKNNNNDNNNLMFLTIEDFLKEFSEIVICYTKKWEDVRIRGKFVDNSTEYNNNSIILSKCFYNINIERETNIIINLFQDDDEFIFNQNNSRKNLLDISLAILKQDNDINKISLIKSLDFSFSSNIQIEIKLSPGNYIIFPRTSGCFFCNNNQALKDSKINFYNQNTEQFSEIFINAIKDIFKKFDLLLNRYLGYKEFKGFLECVQNEKTINENHFNNNILNKYQSYSNGITEKGFIDFFKDIYLSKNGKEEINNWFNKLGYDKNLYPLKSRCFMITFHTETPIKVSVYNTLETYLFSKIERLILISNGKKIYQKDDVDVLQNKSEYNNIFSVGAVNNGQKPYVVEMKVNKKKGYIFSDRRNKIEKMIEPGKCEFYFYYYINENNLYNNSKRGIENNINLDIDYYSVE